MLPSELYDNAGTLFWYRHDGQANGTGAWTGRNPLSSVNFNPGQFQAVMAGGNETIYAVAADGHTHWGRHVGQANGTDTWAKGMMRSKADQWASNLTIHGILLYVSFFAAGNDVIYGVHTDTGNLYMLRHVGQADESDNWRGPDLVSSEDWRRFAAVFAAGNVVYGVDQEGVLYWNRHDGQANSSATWQGWKEISRKGWNDCVSACASGNILYAVHGDGNLWWYKHEGQQNGDPLNGSGTIVGLSGWQQYRTVFAGGSESVYALQADTRTWMSAIPGSRRLNQFTIPGTHDTGTWPLAATVVGITNNAKCQTLSLEEQLLAGIRFIDIRVTQADGPIGRPDFSICHAKVDTGLWFSRDIVRVCERFLRKYPSETIVMSFKDEYGTTDDFEKNLLHYLDSSNALLGNTIPTLQDARRKIVLFRRYEYGTHGIPAYNNWPPDEIGDITLPNGKTLKIQDIYGFGFTDDADLAAILFTPYWEISEVLLPRKEEKVDKKWGIVEAFLKQTAADTGSNTWWIDFGSASGPPTMLNPIDFAHGVLKPGINARIGEFLKANSKGNFGTVMMDFPEDPGQGETIRRLIRTNLQG